MKLNIGKGSFLCILDKTFVALQTKYLLTPMAKRLNRETPKTPLALTVEAYSLNKGTVVFS